MKPVTHSTTRRQAVSRLGMLLGGFAVAARAQQQPAMQQAPATTANRSRTSIHQEIDYAAPAHRIFTILLDSQQFAACTGMSAVIDPSPGGVFKTFGGLVEGRTVEIVPDQRIVQAWRPADWEPGVYSIVRIVLKASGAQTRVALDHAGFQEGLYDHLYAGWNEHYWDPLRKYLA